MAELSKQEREWMNRLDESTNPQEILELSKNQKMRLTPENAQTITEAHARIIARRTAQGEPGKGFMELLLEALSTEDLTQKEAIYEKIIEQERKRVEQELFHRWSDTVDREEYIQLTMQLFPKVSKARAEAMADELNL